MRHYEDFAISWVIKRIMTTRDDLRRHFRSISYEFKRRFFWKGRNRPGRMYRRGRSIDNLFDSTEELYVRCKKDWINDGESIKPANIRFPDQSVNRAKYSKPRDVLLPDSSGRYREQIHWGVARITVNDVPRVIVSTGGGVECHFTVEHDPLEDNYGHSELRVYKEGNRVKDGKKVNQKVKKQYRTIVGLKSRVIVRPLI
jgi:hypothetical protein